MPDADRFALPDLASLAPHAADFWSLRFVEETRENFAVRKNVALPAAAPPTAARWPRSTPMAATATRRPATLRRAGLARGARARGILGARHGAARAPRRSRAAAARAARRIRVAFAAGGGPVAPRLVRPPDAGIAVGGDRFAHRRLGSEHRSAHRDASPRHQRRRRRRAALSLPDARHVGHRARRWRHADAHAQRLPRHLPAGRRRDPRALRLRRRRRGASPTRRSSCSRRPTARPARWTCC